MSKKQQITDILERGTAEVIVKEDLAAKLASGKKLRVKLGIDPTGADLHIGHMVVVKKLQELQKLGHHIMLLFGNFTGQIGDPTGKTQTRAPRTQKELEKNAEKYLDQVKTVLDVNKIEVVWNADWLAPLKFQDVVQLAANFTVAQMLDRDMFQERMKKNQPISMHEFFYPLMQGYDSVAMKADLELGGTDQTFNLLAGRTLQKAYGQEPQNIMTMPILEGLDGKIKMGKSENNYIGVSESPSEMYGKTMSIPDELITKYCELATDMPMEAIAQIELEISQGANPRDYKMKLAREIISIYHGEDAGRSAEKEFIEIFRNKGLPDDIESYTVQSKTSILDLMVEGKMCGSKGEARRLIQGGGVKYDTEKVDDINYEVELKKGDIKLLQVGKRKFLNLKG